MTVPSAPDGSNSREPRRPLWAIEASQETWDDDPAASPAAAKRSTRERRLGLTGRMAATAGSLLAVGALMMTGAAIAAFGDDGTNGAAPTPTAICSPDVTVDCVAPTGSSADATPPPATTDAAPAAAATTATTDAAATAPAATTDAAPAATTAPAAPAGTTAAATPLDATATGAGATPPPATTTTPATTSDNPLVPPPASTPTTTSAFPTFTGDDGSSALGSLVAPGQSGDEVAPAATPATTDAQGGSGSGASGAGLATGSGADSIHAVGISALELLQLQAAGRLAPPPAPLPNVQVLGPALDAQLRAAGARGHVGWTVLAAIAKLESDLGTRGGTFAGARIGLHGDAAAVLPGLATWLAAHGASADASKPFASQDALAAYFGDDTRAERAAALGSYYWALSQRGATRGLAAASAPLAQAVLDDRRITIYKAGRGDIQSGRVDPRVLMAIRYLEAAFGTVRVSSLISGHGIFTTSGSVSAHVFGRAADVAELGGTPIEGHQGPGTVTERAVRLLLMLPKSMAPRQIISLMDLDGPTGNTGSFALPDHHDHIHIGY